ncbi:hypothetical protein TNIN_185301 [Trichonephila inaurata madagascariensis]|uniref:Uncharacterized protein n=1 Tax=Trichonephila inaurata madagascariensis TaxID=2747483 RepID=A0A8X7BXP8_9ARAC|nr:hypothetical protein TNIN_185301 [Trichonephila inaurata madagascariensis]
MEERKSPWEASSVARSFRKRRDVNHISRHFASRWATKSAENHQGQCSTANDRILIKLLLVEMVYSCPVPAGVVVKPRVGSLSEGVDKLWEV